jgi:protein-S-isoprenylcysteine O-methyltransferase Ste14
MLIFAGLHTLSASQTFKQAIRKKMGDRAYHGFYRIAYNIVALISITPVVLAIGMSQHIIWQVPPSHPAFFIMLAIGLVGTIGMVITLLQIDLLRFAGIKQIWAYMTRDILPLPDEPLQLKGFYRMVRHPLYFFGLLSMWSVPIMTDLQLVFTVAASLYFIIGSRWEEQRMVEAFGEAYTDYQQAVPWLVPFVKLG